MSNKEELVALMADMEEEKALRLARAMVESGEDPQDVLDAASAAMTIVGTRFEEKEYYLPELIIAGDMMKEISALVKPRLKQQAKQSQPLGIVVIGTVAGDIHDIGKDVVTFMLDVNNFEVHDLGVDVPAARFVEAIREFKPDIVGLSGFLTLAFEQMKQTVDIIEAAGLRKDIKIMIGGAIMDQGAAAYVGADAYGPDAASAVKLAKGWMATSHA
jgi:5-methyltetrahydrofolate--homocysteine methyltransferase